MKKNARAVYWGMKDSEENLGKRHISGIDFSKINHYSVGEIDGKQVTFREYMKRVYFSPLVDTPENVYDVMCGLHNEEAKHISALEGEERCDERILKRRRENNEATKKALELIAKEVIVWY